MEVFNLFSGHISQEGLARIHSQRQRQGLITDLRIIIIMGDQLRPVLHYLKVISCSQSRYKPSWRNMAVDRRAEALHQEYVDNARRVDSQYSGTAPGTVGPVKEKFKRVQGVVFGAFGEASEPVHRLIDHLATSLVADLSQVFSCES